MMIGSLTNFFDILTAPLLTLGYPLVALLLRQKKGWRLHTALLEVLALSVAWERGMRSLG